MNAIIIGALTGVVVGLVGAGIMLIMALIKKTPHCPDCDEELPRFRRPTNRRQRLWGGWTCPKCGCKMDKYGRERLSDEKL